MHQTVETVTLTRQEFRQVVEAMWEASNGLTVGWSLANVPDDSERAKLQAPITAGQDAILAILRKLDPEAAQG